VSWSTPKKGSNVADSTIQIVFSNPFEGKDDEFNEWYDNVHLPQVLAMPGVISAQRYDLRPLAREDWVGPGFRYMAIYEIDGDPDEVLAATSKAVHAGEIVMSDTFDARNSRLSFWAPRGPKAESQ
jgi:hypothetical protein